MSAGRKSGYGNFAVLVVSMTAPVILTVLVNKFVAGQPQEVVQWQSQSATPRVVSRSDRAGQRVSHVSIANNKNVTQMIQIKPQGLIYEFFTLSMSLPSKRSSSLDLYLQMTLDAVKKDGTETRLKQREFHSDHMGFLDPQQRKSVMVSYTDMNGYDSYTFTIDPTVVPEDEHNSERMPVALPGAVFRLTYITPEFTMVQMVVRGLLSFLMLSVFITFLMGLTVQEAKKAHGQKWMCLLLLLNIGYNDPLYIARMMQGGSWFLYALSTLAKILFSSCLFLFWLILVDGIRTRGVKEFNSFYLPKLVLMGLYFISSSTLFLACGRAPDDLMFSVASTDILTNLMILLMSLCLLIWVVWFAMLMAQVVSKMGVKKAEYLYTQREKFFLVVTVVFMSMFLGAQLFKAMNGRHGSFLKLQLPLCVLVDQYLLLMTYKYWPSEDVQIMERAMTEAGGDEEEGGEVTEGIMGDEEQRA